MRGEMITETLGAKALLVSLLLLCARPPPSPRFSHHRLVLPNHHAEPGAALAGALFALEGASRTLVGCAAQSTGVGTVKAAQKISSTQGLLNASGVSPSFGDFFGNSVASMGDFDGDAVPDICVGAIYDDDGGSGPCASSFLGNPPDCNRGAVYMLFLHTNGTVKASQKISSTEGGLSESGVSLDDGDYFGRSIAAVGDFDGKGATDICVGASSDDDGGSGRGAVYMLFLNSNGTVKAAQKISDTRGVSLRNLNYFGISVASVGDFDSDTVTDICVGAFGDDDGGNGHGAVFVLFLNTNGTVKAAQKISSTQGGLTASGVSLDDLDNFGFSVASVGDFDGDSVPDICVGAIRDDDGGASSNRGAVYMLLLNSNGTVKVSQKISQTAGGLSASGVSLSSDGRFGSSIASLGDFDGDSVTDICVGADEAFDGGVDRGALYVLFLNTDGTVNASQTISSTKGGLSASGISLQDRYYFGISVASVGDFDGDSVTDICVGAAGDDDDGGSVYMLFWTNRSLAQSTTNAQATTASLPLSTSSIPTSAAATTASLPLSTSSIPTSAASAAATTTAGPTMTTGATTASSTAGPTMTTGATTASSTAVSKSSAGNSPPASSGSTDSSLPLIIVVTFYVLGVVAFCVLAVVAIALVLIIRRRQNLRIHHDEVVPLTEIMSDKVSSDSLPRSPGAFGGAGAQDGAPTGDVVMLFTDIQSSTDLWEEMEDTMRLSLRLHDELIRALLVEFEGYEVKTEGDAFFAAFFSADLAVRFALRLQLDLMAVAWPKLLFKHPHAGIVPRTEGHEPALPDALQQRHRNHSISTAESFLYRGVRVRCGMHIGSEGGNDPNLECKRDPNSGRMDYFGRSVNRAARVQGLATGGMTVMTAEVLQALQRENSRAVVSAKTGSRVEGENHGVYEHYGEFKLKGLKKDTSIYTVTPFELLSRPVPEPKGIAGFKNPKTGNYHEPKHDNRTMTVPKTDLDPRFSIDISQLEIGKTLAEGNFGVVSLGEYGANMCVVKQLKATDEQALEDLRKEAVILSHIPPHASLMAFYGAVLNPPNYCLVTEYIDGGNLATLLADNSEVLTGADIVSMSRDLCSGMMMLHDSSMLHLDLAARNVLVMNLHQRPLKLRIADFGLSRVIPEGETSVSAAGCQVAYRYMDPAVLRSKQFNRETDVWAAGVTFWEMTARSVPYPNMESARDVLLACAKGERLPKPPPGGPGLPVHIPDATVDEFYEVMRSCWLPKQRPPFRTLASKLGEMMKRGKWSLTGDGGGSRSTSHTRSGSGATGVSTPPREAGTEYTSMPASGTATRAGYVSMPASETASPYVTIQPRGQENGYGELDALQASGVGRDQHAKMVNRNADTNDYFTVV